MLILVFVANLLMLNSSKEIELTQGKKWVKI
jgi:hypothetical protein